MPDVEYRRISVPEDTLTILRALLSDPEAFVSGSVLARQLGVSRPAVHGKLDKLRAEGFEVEAVRNRGYRIVNEPGSLHPALLRCALDRLGSKIGLRCFALIDSTNSEAERCFASGEPSPFAVVAASQSKGRGRLGRIWQSGSSENLYLSVLFEPNIPPQQFQHCTLWAGICICRALQHFVPDAPLRIKWPNDLHCEGLKFAGMLTEAKLDADSIRSIVFGLGLNVNSRPEDFPEVIRPLATSLRSIKGEVLPLHDVAAAVIRAIEEAYDICINKSDTGAKLIEAWAPLDALSGKPVTAILRNSEVSGIARGIDAEGALVLEMSDGRLEPVRAGDVTLKK